MITLVNKELFNITTEEKTNEKGSYYETTFSSAFDTKNAKTGEMTKRVITKLISNTEDYNACATGVNVRENKAGSAIVGLRSSDHNKYDTNIYLVAIPFNGIVCPIEKSFDFRIYKGLIVSSDKRNIAFNGDMYKKVAYMIVVPNEKVYDESHKYHKDTLELALTTYNLESVGEDKKSVKAVAEVTFSKENITFDIITEECDPVDQNDFMQKNVFPIYIPNKENKPKTGYKNDGYKKPYVRQYNNNKPKKNLDDMISDFNKDADEKHSRINNRNKRR